MCLVLGTFPETLTRNHHLSFIFHQFLRLFCRTVMKCTMRSYCVTIIVTSMLTHSVWDLRAWESPWLYPKMGPWAHLLIGQFKWKWLDYWLNYYNRWKALLLTNRLTSIVDIVCISDFWDIWGWNHMTNDLWFSSAIDLVGLHLHVLGAVVRKGKLHYFVPQFYFLIWFIPILTEWKWKHYSNFCFDSA